MIDIYRDHYTFGRKTSIDLLDNSITTIDGFQRRGVSYPDLYTNYVRVESGARMFEALGLISESYLHLRVDRHRSREI